MLTLVIAICLFLLAAASPKKRREQLVSSCEHRALKVGSDLADAFNAPVGDEVPNATSHSYSTDNFA